MEEGNTSLEDWEALTWSLGWIARPEAWEAIVAMTSLAFMFEEVPDPVWKMSIGNWSSCAPAMTSSAAATIASLVAWSMTPSSRLVSAAARLICPSAAMWWGLRWSPEIGKFSTARWVCAR